MIWDNENDFIKISFNKISDKEYKLRISNKNNDTYETIINDYYWTSEFIVLSDLKTLLTSGLKNETIENLNCSTLIKQNENSITVTLSFYFENKFIKQRPPDITINLDKVIFDEIEKNKFIVKDVIDEIQPIIDNEHTILCCCVMNYDDLTYKTPLTKVINCANEEELLNCVYYTEIFKYFYDLNYRIFNIKILRTPNQKKKLYEICHSTDRGLRMFFTLSKSAKKYSVEILSFYAHINDSDKKSKMSNTITGKYKILLIDNYSIIIEREG